VVLAAAIVAHELAWARPAARARDRVRSALRSAVSGHQVLAGVYVVLGVAAIALAAVRLARRSPAADRMLAWTGAGRHAPGRARALEVAVVLGLSGALSALALLALQPLAHLLLEPGDGRTPPAALVIPGSVLLAATVWLVVAAVAAAAGMALAASSQSTVEVLRGED